MALFGVGDAEGVDLWIRWPDGRQSEVPDVTTGQWIELIRED